MNKNYDDISPDMSQPNSNFEPNFTPPPPTNTPYMGGVPVRCTRCSNVVNTRYCNYCGMDLSTIYAVGTPPQAMPDMQSPFNQPYPYYPVPPFQQKRSTGKTVGIVFLVIGIVAAVLIIISAIFGFFAFSTNFETYHNQDQFEEILPNNPGNKSADFPPGVSVDEFNKLKVGMSYAQISSIIGGDGKLIDNGENLKKETFYTYAWPGEINPDNTTVYITITNDVASDISQEGLF